jgi:NitT/TauT family transport system substrate-binding protein
VNRSARTLLVIALCAMLAGALVACSPATTPGTTTGNTTGTPAPAPVPVPNQIRIGTLPTEDSLPLWVAERDGLFTKAGIDVTTTVFASAVERDAALTAGAIDGEMGDLIAASLLREGGVPVKVATVMLGATAKEGRFGIAVKPGSKVTTLKGLAGVPVGTSSSTIQEFVLDQLMASAGVSADQVKTVEIKKVPVRFQQLMSGAIDAAALPEPFLSLAAKTGAKVIADDTKGANISQTVLIFSEKFLSAEGSSDKLTKLLGAWDTAVGTINADPNSFRQLLVDQAKLPAPLATSYAVNTYPKAQLPTTDEVTRVLEWMQGKGLIKTPLTYADLTWTAPAK